MGHLTGKKREYLLALIIFSMLFLLSLSQAQAAERYDYVTKWGSAGTGSGQFDNPSCGVAVDRYGNVYVADTDNHRIQKFNSSGGFITSIGHWGWDNGELNYPKGVAVDSSGNIYVADSISDRVQKFNSAGTFVTKWGGAGTANGKFNIPIGIAVDGAGNVYVADSVNDRIQKFSSSGTFLTKWGSAGSANGQFHTPYGVAVDGSGNVYVADLGNHRIQKFNSSGGFITKWGNYGNGNGQFTSGRGVAVDGSGNVYVADNGENRVQKFSSSGAFITRWGSLGSGNGQLNGPMGIAADSSGNIYVGEYWNNRVQKFKLGDPIGALKINNGAAYAKSSTVTLNSAVSGATWMRFQNAGGPWSGWMPFSPARSWTLPAANGARTVNAQYINTAGTYITRSDTITLDTVPPRGVLKINNGGAFTPWNTVILYSYVAGASQMRFKNAGGNWSAWVPFGFKRAWIIPRASGNKVVYAQYRDWAGNTIMLADTIWKR